MGLGTRTQELQEAGRPPPRQGPASCPSQSPAVLRFLILSPWVAVCPQCPSETSEQGCWVIKLTPGPKDRPQALPLGPVRPVYLRAGEDAGGSAGA